MGADFSKFIDEFIKPKERRTVFISNERRFCWIVLVLLLVTGLSVFFFVELGKTTTRTYLATSLFELSDECRIKPSKIYKNSEKTYLGYELITDSTFFVSWSSRNCIEENIYIAPNIKWSYLGYNIIKNETGQFIIVRTQEISSVAWQLPSLDLNFYDVVHNWIYIFKINGIDEGSTININSPTPIGLTLKHIITWVSNGITQEKELLRLGFVNTQLLVSSALSHCEGLISANYPYICTESVETSSISLLALVFSIWSILFPLISSLMRLGINGKDTVSANQINLR